MISGRSSRVLRLAAALLAGACASGAGAQPSAFPVVEDSSATLNRHLKELADSPRSLSALLGAARAAIELGDPQAAVTFYARAEEIAPRDGRIKAGIAAAFLAMEQPEPALRFLEDARALGFPEGAIAADRGLAHDLLGDPVAAQRDYQLAMRVNDNDELRRRLALSRAITGDRGGALSALEDQLRRGSPAGRRVRAFVLALTGDASGATEAARAAMPAQAAMLQPFFARLPSLRPAERAMAVHFGHFPGDGPPGQAPLVTSTYAALPPGVTLGGRPDPKQPAFAARKPAPSASSAGQGTQLAARSELPARRVTSPAAAVPSSSSSSGTASALASAARPSGPVQGPPDGGARPVAVTPASNAGPAARTAAPTPGISAIELPASAPITPLRSVESAPAPASSARPRGLAAVAAAIEALPDEGAGAPKQELALLAKRPELPAVSAAPPPSEPAATRENLPAPSQAAATEAAPTQLAKRGELPATPAQASAPAKPPPLRRFWVQLGGKPDEAALKAEFARLKAKVPELLGDKVGWTAPASAESSRLLVGPFKSREDVDLFVELLGEEGLRATAWTSPAGQEIVKLAAK